MCYVNICEYYVVLYINNVCLIYDLFFIRYLPHPPQVVPSVVPSAVPLLRSSPLLDLSL